MGKLSECGRPLLGPQSWREWKVSATGGPFSCYQIVKAYY